MRGHGFPVVAMALLLVAACGCDGGSSPSVTEPTAPRSTSVTTEPAPPPTTSAPTVDTTIDPTATEMAVLRSDGLGPIDFGTPAGDAIAGLTEVLGAPDRVEPIEPGGECVEGSGWLDCVGERVVESGRLAVWDRYGLEVALVDTARYDWSREQMPLQFSDWHATVPPGDASLVTDEGLYPGMTVGELRAVVPWVEFGYGEGVLGGFYVSFGVRGGYGGGLDWDPETAEVDWYDVAAMQAALNEQGAELEVDGVWGPASKEAWIAFLSDHGLDSPALAAEWPLWLTPEIGRTLGLPPDDIIAASLEPRPVMEAAVSTLWLPILRVDGLASSDFGVPANELVGQLTSMLGPPSQETSLTPDGAGPFDFLPNGYWAAYELRVVHWERPDLQLILSDVPWLGDQFGEAVPGTLHLISWTTTSSSLRLDTGIAVGSSLGELRAAYPDVVVGTNDVCGTSYDPAFFVTTPFAGDVPPLWLGGRGTLDWDWTRDLQAELNDRGTDLVVDGIYGPATRAAVAEFQQAQGIDEGTAPDAGGLIGPRTADSLDLDAPDSAQVTRLGAGYPGSC